MAKNKVRTCLVKLERDEVWSIIQELKQTPHQVYLFYGYDKTIKKLEKALGEGKHGKN